MKNGIAPIGLISASSEINDFRISIEHRARALRDPGPGKCVA
jgi:hypothetical protein